jgi:magnesium-transporting ATPase (P-type)
MMIVVVGEESCIGKIRALLDQEEEVMTPLQQKLEKLASDIGKFGLYSALLILTVLLVRFGIERGISR